MDPQMVWDLMDEHDGEIGHQADSITASKDVTPEKEQAKETGRKSKSSWMGFPRYCAE